MGCCVNYFSERDNLDLNLELEKDRQRYLLRNLPSLRDNNWINNINSNLNTENINKNYSMKNSLDLIDKKNTINSIENNNEKNNIEKELFLLINNLRRNPGSFIQIINKYLSLIEFNDKINSYYINVNNYNIIIDEGKECFEEAINFLISVDPMKNLVLDDNLRINFPEDNINLCDDKDYLNNEINRINSDKKYNNIDYICNKNVHNAEFIIVMNLLDPNNKERPNRKILMNTNYNKIGVNCYKIDEKNNVYCFYLIFGDDKIKEI